MLMCLYSCKGGYPLLLFGCLESFEHLSRYTESCKLNITGTQLHEIHSVFCDLSSTTCQVLLGPFGSMSTINVILTTLRTVCFNKRIPHAPINPAQRIKKLLPVRKQN